MGSGQQKGDRVLTNVHSELMGRAAVVGGMVLCLINFRNPLRPSMRNLKCLSNLLTNCIGNILRWGNKFLSLHSLTVCSGSHDPYHMVTIGQDLLDMQ